MDVFDKLDYRRFDHLGSDSDEDSAEDQTDSTQIEEIIRKLGNGQEGFSSGSPSLPWAAVGHRSGRIKIHPADHTCPSWVYSDPDTWVAPLDPREPQLLHHGP